MTSEFLNGFIEKFCNEVQALWIDIGEIAQNFDYLVFSIEMDHQVHVIKISQSKNTFDDQSVPGGHM
ncbi:MAG: hypothetical protein ISS17_01525 [Bacteroidales bacterium]|nr:hypothetical protein [Bacteroidales bacterium]